MAISNEPNRLVYLTQASAIASQMLELAPSHRRRSAKLLWW
ncbi:hypothetical protein [Coleofasciculus chthonoplastes]